MNDTPLITVALSVRNAEPTVARAIRSILVQTYPNFEFIIVDDGSTDGTAAQIESFTDPRITLINDNQSLGLAARLNQIVALARGSYIARMDGDDFSYPERFQRQIAFLHANPTIDLVGTGAVAFNAENEPIGAFRREYDHKDICARPELGFGIAHPTWMGRTAWFRRFPYPTGARRAQDQAVLIAAYRDSRFANLPDILFGYRQDAPTLNSVVGGRWHHLRALASHAIEQRNWPLLNKSPAALLARTSNGCT